MVAFTTEIECDEEELRGLRQQLDEWLGDQGMPAEPAFHVKLTVHEVARNAIVHADPCDHVKVRAEVAEDEVVVEIVDTNAEPWELDAETGDGIRGLRIIRALARRLEVVPRSEGTAVVVALPRG